jgi:hypothetical protein
MMKSTVDYPSQKTSPRLRQNRKLFERGSAAIMAIGILMVWQPWVHAFFQWGFLVTLGGIVAFTVASHMAVHEE